MHINYGKFNNNSTAKVKVDKAFALECLGYTGQHIDKHLQTRFNKLSHVCESTIVPSYAWGVFDVCSLAGRIDVLGTALCLCGQSITEHLKGASKVAVMACTLGAESERSCCKYRAVDAADGVMFSACCSSLVEQATNAMDALIVEWAALHGFKTNSRFSPGYGDLSLEVQSALLDALHAKQRLGISVTKGKMMFPTKSITAVKGLFLGSVMPKGTQEACTNCNLANFCKLKQKGACCNGRCE